ncbi:hypothetical protein MPSEU_001014900 [Mayamaea pseudoterrestris]|nr:hypothetical protein MPSEU_001014900 [Mayamaea pseudoterrestris]
MESCFAAIHRLGTPENGLGEDFRGCSEVELVRPELIHAAFQGSNIRIFAEYGRTRIVWLSRHLFLIDSRGPIARKLRRHDEFTFLLHVTSHDGHFHQDLKIGVYMVQNDGLQPMDTLPLDNLLHILRALRIKSVEFDGKNAGSSRFPFSSAALATFVEPNDSLTTLSISYLCLDKGHFDALGASLIPNLCLVHVQVNGTFPVTLNTLHLYINIYSNNDDCIWSLNEASQVTSLRIHTSQGFPYAGETRDALKALCVRNATSLANVLHRLRLTTLRLSGAWFDLLTFWEALCPLMKAHPTMQKIGFDPLIRTLDALQEPYVYSQLIADLVKSSPFLQDVQLPKNCKHPRTWICQIVRCLQLNKMVPLRMEEVLKITNPLLRRAAIRTLVIMARRQKSKSQIYFIVRSACDVIF